MEIEHDGRKIKVVIHCVFREPGENDFFAVVENERTERILIIRINAAVFNALRALGVPECPVVSAVTCSDCRIFGPICIHCVFCEERKRKHELELEPEPEPESESEPEHKRVRCFAVLEDELREQVTIVVINEDTFDALRKLGIPLCPVVSCRDHEDDCDLHAEE